MGLIIAHIGFTFALALWKKGFMGRRASCQIVQPVFGAFAREKVSKYFGFGRGKAVFLEKNG